MTNYYFKFKNPVKFSETKKIKQLRQILVHRFLTGERISGSAKITKVKYCTPLLQDSRGPLVVPKDTLRVHGNFVDF